MKHIFPLCLLVLGLGGPVHLAGQEVAGPMLPDAHIRGGVVTERGEEVEAVQVNVMGYSATPRTTGVDGNYAFGSLPTEHNYTLSASNDQALLNGLNTLDLILLSRHVLGTARLDSPYKMIAADVDRSGHISALDIIRLRRLLLQLDEELPNQNTSWRFVDASYVFPDPDNPFATYFPEMYNVGMLEDHVSQADFVAVKVGDVDGSARTNGVFRPEPTEGGNQPVFEIQVADQAVAAGDWVDITFRAEYMNEMQGYQFTLEFDPNALEVMDVLAGDLPNLFPEENFNLSSLSEGVLTTLWHEFDMSATGRESILFTLHCQARQSGHLRDWLYLGSRYLKAEAYGQNGETMDVGLSFARPDAVLQKNGFELFQNRPNPWKDETIIPFQLEVPGEVRLSIYDVAGKLVYYQAGSFSQGYHELGIERDDLPAIGVFYYTLETNGYRATRRMVLTN
ncbi:MAG: T9SS type A sorting domain-containing protein [Lewinella sp.]|nr:T9SS type A sorting domain-containing protein [Lewinella sp.]